MTAMTLLTVLALSLTAAMVMLASLAAQCTERCTQPGCAWHLKWSCPWARGPPVPSDAVAECYITTEGLDQRLSPCAAQLTRKAVNNIPADGNGADGIWEIVVDDTPAGAQQIVDGFGASWTDATVAAFDALAPARQEQLLEELFGASGIGLSLMRHTIGMSDLTPDWLRPWSFDETPKPDPKLDSFKLTEPGRRMLAWLRRMRKARPDTMLFGSVWSPPQWMKTADNTLASEHVGKWASYLVKYLQAYQAGGVTVDALTPQNEPLHSADKAWTMYADASMQTSMVSNLSAAIKAAKLDTKIWIYDHNTDHPEVPQHIIDSAPEAVGAVAWHCYTANNTWPPMTEFHKKNPGLKQYMSECWTHVDEVDGVTAEDFFFLPTNIGGPMRHWGSGALSWNLGGSTKYDVSWPTGCKMCSGLAQVDMEAGTVQLTQDYYTLGQFSKFVKRGATGQPSSARGGNSGERAAAGSALAAEARDTDFPSGKGVHTTAFTNPDGARVVVIENQGKSDVELHLKFLSGDAWSGHAAGRSISTWIVPKASTVRFA